MITGFRWVQLFYNVQPDMCTFGNAITNDHSVAALVGSSEIMKLGNILEECKELVFLNSTTNGAEMSTLVAFIKTIEISLREKVIEKFWIYGDKLVSVMNEITQQMGLGEHFFVEGYPCLPNYVTKDSNIEMSLAMRTLLAREMVTNGALMPYISIAFLHKGTEFDQALSAVRNSL